MTAHRLDGTAPAVGVSPSIESFCVTAAAVFLHPSVLTEAEVAGRPERAGATAKLTYAVAAWLAQRLPDAGDVEHAAASVTGCALARLGVRGDALTESVLELRGWSGPHAHARAWTRALTKGHVRCAN